MKTMKFTALLIVLLAVSLEAARRSRGRVRYGGRQLPFLRQPEVPATNDAWEHTEVLKLDPHTESWQPELQGDGIALNNRVETAALPFTSDFSRQYPGFPGGDGQVPNPIQPEDPNQPGPGKPGGSGSGGSGGSGGEQPGRPGIPAPGCLADRGQFPSPNNCANYLNCWDETVIEQQCPNNLLFNDVTGLCDFEQNVNCGNRPGPTPSQG